jgi:hypothetical protein
MDIPMGDDAPSGSRNEPSSITATHGQQQSRQNVRDATKSAGMVQITCQLHVDRYETLTEIPENWPVAQSGDSVAYVLNLSHNPHCYKDVKGDSLSMAMIIKNKVFCLIFVKLMFLTLLAVY